MAAPQTAIRVGDDILHSEANSWGVFGIVEGALIGLAIGVLVVSTGGLAGVALVAGATLLGGALGGKLGEIYGRHQTHANGHVLTGSPNVFIGHDKQPAARADADVGHCDQHSDSEPAHNQPAILGKKIAQGSGTVLINNFHAARSGDKGTCDFTLGDGWPNVFIGGPTQTVLEITSETGLLDHVLLGMMIVGGVLLAGPAVAGMIGEGVLAGTGGWTIAGQIATRLGGQFLLGAALSKAGGAGLKYAGGKYFGDGSLGQDISEFVGENAVPFVGMIKIPGLGESSYGWIDSMPERFGFGNKAAGAAGDIPGAAASDAAADVVAPTAGSADASAADMPNAGEVSEENTPQRYGGTGADPEPTSTEASQARANAAYDQIRSNPNDVNQIAQNTGHSPETIQTVKDHLFNSQHDILDPNTGEVSQGNFTPDEGISNLWNKAADGSLGQPRMTNWDTPIEGSANPGEVTQFNQLVAHEYVESQMVADGFPYQARGSWTENPAGGWDYTPNPDNFGAHELSPNFTENPYSHYEKITGLSPDGIPRPNADNTNLDEVVAGIRRTLEENGGGAGGKGPGGGMGTGAEARSPLARDAKGRFSSKPEPEPFDPPGPLRATAVEGIDAVPPGEAAPVAAADAAPEAAEARAALPKTDPTDALAAPEPAPEAAAKADLVASGRSQEVKYNEFDMSKKAVEFRANEKDSQGLYNVAVFEYVEAGSDTPVMEAFKSEGRFKPHSEKVGLRTLLEERKMTPDQITRVYTEREPCELPGNYCGRLLGRVLPETPVFHSFEYGGDPAMTKVEAQASRQRGNDALADALNSIFGGSQ